jgi:hypothetical protein
MFILLALAALSSGDTRPSDAGVAARPPQAATVHAEIVDNTFRRPEKYESLFVGASGRIRDLLGHEVKDAALRKVLAVTPRKRSHLLWMQVSSEKETSVYTLARVVRRIKRLAAPGGEVRIYFQLNAIGPGTPPPCAKSNTRDK